MKDEERIELNKKIRAYDGDNTFLNSLKRSFNSKYVQKIKVGNRTIKILSDRQYEAAKTNF